MTNLFEINSLYFDYNNCSFAKSIMFEDEKDDKLSRNGSGRVGIYNLTNIEHCYTLECNYNRGNHINNFSTVLRKSAPLLKKKKIIVD